MEVKRLPPSASPGYRPDIDGLRAVSIIVVVLFHAFPTRLPAGFIGVDVFFVISGFLIGGLISSELAAGTFRFSSFYIRRIARIFPSLVLVLAFVWVAGWNVMFAEEFARLGKHIAGAAIFVSNFVLLGEVGYFDTEAPAKALLHLWSLAIEEQFYLLWPLFAWLMRRKRTLFIAAIAAMALASFACNVAASDPSTSFYSPQARFWELAVGVLLAHLPKDAVTRWLPVQAGREVVCLLGLSAILLGAFVIPIPVFPGWWALMPVLGAALAIAAGASTSAGRLLLATRPMVFVGKISYPLYLWHWPLFVFAWLAYGETAPGMVRVAIVALSAVLAWLTYEFVEKPIRFGAHRTRAVKALVGFILILGAGGVVTMQLGGIPERRVAEVNRALAYDLRVPTDSRTSDGSCAKKDDIETGPFSVCFVSSPKPRFLVVGDSVSMAFYSAIRAGMVREDAALVGAHSYNWRRPACVETDDFAAWLKGPEACQAVIRNAFDILRRESSIEAVVLPVFTGNPFFDRPAVLEALQDAVLGLGKKIVYVTSVPEFSRPPGGCHPRKLALFGHDLSRPPDVYSCRQSREPLVAALDPQRRRFAAMSKPGASVSLYESLPPLCDSEVCHQSDVQGPLFWSWAHVNERGSRRILEAFLPWLHKNVLGER